MRTARIPRRMLLIGIMAWLAASAGVRADGVLDAKRKAAEQLVHDGKYTDAITILSEVTAAVSIDECWQLLDAVKASGRTYMLAENYCYMQENVLVREMAAIQFAYVGVDLPVLHVGNLRHGHISARASSASSIAQLERRQLLWRFGQRSPNTSCFDSGFAGCSRSPRSWP